MAIQLLPNFNREEVANRLAAMSAACIEHSAGGIMAALRRGFVGLDTMTDVELAEQYASVTGRLDALAEMGIAPSLCSDDLLRLGCGE